MDINILRSTFGIINKVKILEGNFSVKVMPFPAPAQYNGATPACYGGIHDPDPNDSLDDGNGYWIPLGDHPSTIAALYSEDLTGQFVRIDYVGNFPWNGRAFIASQPGQESINVLSAKERGPFRILSANGF